MRSPIRVFSVAEYLEAERKSELRHKYLDGQIFFRIKPPCFTPLKFLSSPLREILILDQMIKSQHQH